MTILWVLLGVGALFLIIFAGMYNGLIAKKNQVENAESSIDVMLRKRGDLIPQLVDTAKAFMTHEKELLEGITKLRARILDLPEGSPERMKMENQMSQQLSQFMINVENYPDLKSDVHFTNIQRNVSEVEEQLSAARRSYNASVTDFNNKVEMFPSNIIAGMFGFKVREWYELPADFNKEPTNIGDMFSK